MPRAFALGADGPRWSGVISKYEVTGQQLILYVTALDSKATLNLGYKLTQPCQSPRSMAAPK